MQAQSTYRNGWKACRIQRGAGDGASPLSGRQLPDRLGEVNLEQDRLPEWIGRLNPLDAAEMSPGLAAP